MFELLLAAAAGLPRPGSSPAPTPTGTGSPAMGSAWRRPSSARPTIADLDEPAHSVMAVLALATIIVVASAFFAVCGLRGYLRFRERAMEEAAYARAVLGADAFDFPA